MRKQCETEFNIKLLKKMESKQSITVFKVFQPLKCFITLVKGRVFSRIAHDFIINEMKHTQVLKSIQPTHAGKPIVKPRLQYCRISIFKTRFLMVFKYIVYVCNRIGQNSMHISDIFNWYSVNYNEIRKAWMLLQSIWIYTYLKHRCVNIR